VKPDGRKPRVKANIRARFANRGAKPFGAANQGEAATGFRHSTKVTTNQEAFDEASSQLALAPAYTGEEEEELKEDDNTEKREINTEETVQPGPNRIVEEDVDAKPSTPSFIHLPNLQPVILNSRQSHRPGGPSLPPDVLARIQHITDINNLPPLPTGARPLPGGLPPLPSGARPLVGPLPILPSGARPLGGPHRPPRSSKPPVLEERSDVVSEDEPLPSLLDQLVPSPVISSPNPSKSSGASKGPQLSAFRALVQQTEKGDSANSLV